MGSKYISHLKGLFVALLAASLLLGTVQTREMPIYIPFVSDEVVDYPTVRISMGRPERSYQLRLDLTQPDENDTFTAAECVSVGCLDQEAARIASRAAVVLYDETRTLRHRSNIYETLVPGLIGRDIAHIGGTYLPVNILFLPRPSNIPMASSETLSLSTVGCDGYLRLSFLRNVWPLVAVDRHGVRLWTDADILDTNSNNLTRWDDAVVLDACESTQLKTASTLAVAAGYPYPLTCSGCATAWIDGLSYPVCVVGNLDVAFFPQTLYTSYFGRRSIYDMLTKVSPDEWPSLLLTTRATGGLENNKTMVFSVTNRAVLPIVDGAESLDLTYLEQSAATAATGGDTLKLLPQTVDNVTIILSGHLLWVSGIVMIRAPSRTTPQQTRLLVHTAEQTFTFWQAVLFIIILFCYLRWKMSTISYVNEAQPVAHAYVERSGADGVIWPYAMPLWLAPLVIGWRWDAVQTLVGTQLDARVFTQAVVGGAIAFGLLMIVLPTEWKLLKQWSVHSQRYAARYLRQTPNQLIYTLFIDPQQITDNAGERNKMRYHRSVSVTALRDTAIEAASATMVWFFFAPLESRAFALPMMLILLTALSACTLYHLFTVAYTTIWPPITSWWRFGYVRTRVQLVRIDVAILLGLVVASAHMGYLTLYGALIPLFVQYATPMPIFSTIATLFISTIVFLTGALADMGLQSAVATK